MIWLSAEMAEAIISLNNIKAILPICVNPIIMENVYVLVIKIF
jgi:hypothetical protein